MRVVVENVGRSRLTWQMDVWDEPAVAVRQILSEVERRRALMSHDIEITWKDDGASGAILVGSGRIVGTWRRIDEVAA